MIFRILFFFIIMLMTSGFFKNSKENALENCANSKFITKHPMTMRFESKKIAEKIKTNNEFRNSIINIQKAEEKLKIVETNLFNYAKDKFYLEKNEVEKILKKSYRNPKNMEGLSDEVLEILGLERDPEKIEKLLPSGTKEQKNEFKKLVSDLNYANKNFDTSMDWRGRLTTYLFLKSKVKEKFKDKRYQKYFENCEREHNKLPSSFINKWEDNDLLETFYKKYKPNV